jgi:phosphatidylserine decarboxylase
MSIAREGWPHILIPLLLGALVAPWLPWLGLILILLGAFSAFFFRDPEREIPAGVGLIVSPADGRVVQVLPAPAEHPLGAGTTQVSIFLSIFNVHINRAPIAGRVSEVSYNKGAFLPAFDDKASLRNEQNVVTLEDGATRVVFKQIAGLIARRIVFWKRPGEGVQRGERVGLIKFGSRVDLFLPGGTEIRVKVGDRVAGGSSVIGSFSGVAR